MTQTQAAALAAPRPQHRFKRFLRRNATGYIFLAPFLILLFIFVVVPVGVSVVLSFTNYNMLQPPKFVGLENYMSLILNDDVFLIALKNTFVFALLIGPIGYFMSFLMAWILDTMKARNLFSIAFYAPSITSAVAMTVVWLYFFSPDWYGMVNNALTELGLITEPILWNADPRYIMPVVVLISVWMSMGNGFLVFLAGLQNLPDEVFEQARIDGVGSRFQELFYMTLPMMKPQLLFGAINAIVASFSVFDIAVQFAGMPSPNYAAHTLVAHLFDHAFIRFEMGYASAVSVVLFLITFSLGKLCTFLLRSDDE